MSLGVHDDLVEDPQERASFDRSTKTLYGGRPLRAIAAALTQFSKANPEQGSLSKMLAIYSNEVALADKNYAYVVKKNAELERALETAREGLKDVASRAHSRLANSEIQD